MLTVLSVLLDDFSVWWFSNFNLQSANGLRILTHFFITILANFSGSASSEIRLNFVCFCLWTQQVFRVLVRRYGEFTKLLVTWAKCCNAFATDVVFCSFIVSPGHLTVLRDKENLLVHLRVYWNFKNLNVYKIINNYSSSPNGLMRARGIIVLVKSN